MRDVTHVQVALSSLDEHDLKIVVQIGQAASNDTSADVNDIARKLEQSISYPHDPPPQTITSTSSGIVILENV